MELALKFVRYIAHPYWPEMDQVVTITKQSGMNRARSEDKREKSLQTYLEKIGMTNQQFAELQAKADRKWYRADNDDETSEIIIPRHQFSGCLVQACASAPAGCRYDQEELRSILQVGDFRTGKFTHDWILERFVKPMDGKGNVLSNQRRLTKSWVILDFNAVGTVEWDPRDAKEKNVLDLLRHAGRKIGVGAARKMGYGRFDVLVHVPDHDKS